MTAFTRNLVAFAVKHPLAAMFTFDWPISSQVVHEPDTGPLTS